MPLYEFKCLKCGQKTTKWQFMYEDHVCICNKCNIKMDRIFSPPAIIINGSSVTKEIQIDKEMQLIEKALLDERPVTKTEFEVAAEQLEKRAERRGENKEELLHDVLGIGKGKKSTKEERKIKTEKQRTLHGK